MGGSATATTLPNLLSLPLWLSWFRLDSQEGLLETWNNANADLDMVQKGPALRAPILRFLASLKSVSGLDDYLETKRGAFARFYFLSNAGASSQPRRQKESERALQDELLEILSQTKDLEAIELPDMAILLDSPEWKCKTKPPCLHFLGLEASCWQSAIVGDGRTHSGSSRSCPRCGGWARAAR